MNITVDEKLLDNSRKIDSGIKFLCNQVSNVINKHNVSNEIGSKNNVMEKYKQNIAIIKDSMKCVLKEQKETEALFQKLELQQKQTQTDLEEIIKRNNINSRVWNCKLKKENTEELP